MTRKRLRKALRSVIASRARQREKTTTDAGVVPVGLTLCPICERALARLAGYAVPVVRCKDCKHYDMGVCLKIYSDGNVHPEAWQSRKPDDFCSYGERREAKT